MASNKDKLIAGAQKLVEKGSHEKAIKEYLKVVALDEKDVRIWLKIGDLYAKIGKKTEASETYQRVAQFYSDQGFYLKSVAVYKQILKLDPRQVDINQRLADLYKQLGLLSDAMQQYEMIANFFQKEGKTRDALLALKQIVDMDPETVANRIKLAEQYSKEQMNREAIEEFSKAAEQLRQAGRTDEFMKVAERLLFLSPDNRPVSKELASMYIDKADPRRALPKLQVCFKADPRDTEVLGLLAKAFEALDQRQKSVSVLKELARILNENGDKRARDDVYRKIVVLAPGDAEAEAALAKSGSGHSKPNVISGAAPAGAPPRWQTAWNMPPSGGTDPSLPALDDAPLAGALDEAPLLEVDANNDFSAPPVQRPSEHTAVGEYRNDDPSARLASEGSDEDEITKILNETDVYIKYNLHQKAIDHLQRVFERDPQHVEAREKLKALYLASGRQSDAILELWALYEHSGPQKGRRYLREIAEIDPDDARARGLLEGGGAAEAVPAAPEPIAGEETIDVDDIEELSEDDFDVSDPSGVVELTPEVEAALAEPADDDIPLTVDSGQTDTSVEEAPLVEDRFSLDDDSSAGPDFDAPTGVEDTMPPVQEETQPAPRTEGANLEDDLDEADFFIQQGLFEEARAILDALESRFAGHQLVATKRGELEEAERAAGPAAGSEPVSINEPARDNTDLAEMPPDAGEGEGSGVFSMQRKNVIEKGVGAEDFETHFDLGIAYKEMGLVDEAISEFKLVMRDPTRQVQCHHMIGLCYMEKGQMSEAVNFFKKALYVEGISDRETLSLYFDLGQAYERLKDTREARYYYEKVQKRDPAFREVQRLIDGLDGAPAEEPAPPQASSDDVDNAFDNILGD